MTPTRWLLGRRVDLLKPTKRAALGTDLHGEPAGAVRVGTIAEEAKDGSAAARLSGATEIDLEAGRIRHCHHPH